MPRRIRMRLIAGTAIVALFVIAGNGSARRLSFNGQTFRIVWNAMRFIPRGETGLTCRVTLQGTLIERNVAKLIRGTIGEITEASIAGCTGAGITLLTETLPWRLKYEGFDGTLPNINQIRTTLSMPFRWGTAIFGCLYPPAAGSEPKATWVRGAAGGERANDIILVNWDEGVIIPSTSNGCGELSMRLGGTGIPSLRFTEVLNQMTLI